MAMNLHADDRRCRDKFVGSKKQHLCRQRPTVPRSHGPARQVGAALLTAMLTVALVASLAAGALWQQWRSIEVETAERARVQSAWILTGALDWARLILREDARSAGPDYLSEPWAVPLEEARLSTFLAADKNNTADSDPSASQAFLSGLITDLQARLNVRNLVEEGGKVSETWLKAFAKLFEALRLPPAELTALAENLRLALDRTPENEAAQTAPLLPQRLDQLVWLGLSPASLAVLRPYITLLPVSTPVNLNTASATVLFAVIPSLDMAQAQRLVMNRQASHFRTLADVTAQLGQGATALNLAQQGVNSRFFEVQGRLRLDQNVVEEHSVLQREGLDVKTVWRDRGTLNRQTSALQ
ncbi:MAG: ral secretion pathway protein [Polaromonas sp.]|nr:ral secretion pathway protein [Polaromonas sp.]